jgi:hypothetical protein
VGEKQYGRVFVICKQNKKPFQAPVAFTPLRGLASPAPVQDGYGRQAWFKIKMNKGITYSLTETTKKATTFFVKDL